MRCLVLGSGTWGASLAWVLRQNGHQVVLWCRREERARELRQGRHGYLPGVDLGPGFDTVVGDEAPAGDFDIGVSTIPTQHLRKTVEALLPRLPRGLTWVSGSILPVATTVCTIARRSTAST